MRLTWRDGVATGLVAASMWIYVMSVDATGGAVRGAAAFMLVLGATAGIVGSDLAGDVAFPGGRLLAALGTLALVAGVTAMATANQVALTGLAFGTLTLWLVSTVRHLITERPAPAGPGHRPRVGGPTAQHR